MNSIVLRENGLQARVKGSRVQVDIAIFFIP